MYYAGILCPSPVEKKVLKFKNWMKEQFGCIVALKSPAHITLIPPFWLEETREPELLQALHSFTNDVDEMEIQLDGFSHFGKRVLFVRVKENVALQELRNHAENYFIHSFGGNIKKDCGLFHPHVTIANRDLKPGDFEKAWLYFSNKEFNVSFFTRTISLLKLSSGKWDFIGSVNW